MTTSSDETTKVLRFGIRTPEQLSARTKELGTVGHIVEGIIPRQSLSLVVGDSGLGKSPLLYQAAISVAAGVPFLGRPVQKGPVLYLDCENGLEDVETILSQISKGLGLEAAPPDMLVWNFNDSDGTSTIKSLVEEARPTWVIVDPLNAFYPDIESKAEIATVTFQQLRLLMTSAGCSLTGVHHIRKPSADAALPTLDEPNCRPWFLQARGSRALINGCDIRIGIDQSWQNEEQLFMRGFGRMRGDIPLMRIARVNDEHGEPQCFSLMVGVDLLNNPNQQETFARLPNSFNFTVAKAIYGKADQATNDFLKKCISVGIVRKLPGKKGYEKIQLAVQTAELKAA